MKVYHQNEAPQRDVRDRGPLERRVAPTFDSLPKTVAASSRESVTAHVICNASECGRWFAACLRDAKYCSDRCRQQAYRDRRRPTPIERLAAGKRA